MGMGGLVHKQDNHLGRGAGKSWPVVAPSSPVPRTLFAELAYLLLVGGLR